MDIAMMSIAMHQGKAQQQASMAVMKQSMDIAKGQGEGLEKLMESANVQAPQASHPHLGGSVDVSV
ncbi:YjfB family protein [Salisediminibacterium selenitireducens]|uniref:Motility protein n=1 Tax=Bacillus selenitireducens (strain ATCC 700615 / DSM 15326 / MLS10) TaxID=439292 RepID=D6Y0W9_BACIE|nr:YjfB family protein [Salisediminibacterium selenitireducens]ADH98573.1 hypothetical protein Bsel_1054 [[Bacillus] selenitireducens MLS10]